METNKDIQDLINYWPIVVLFIIIVISLLITVCCLFKYLALNKINNIKPTFNDDIFNLPTKRQFKLRDSWPAITYTAKYRQNVYAEYDKRSQSISVTSEPLKTPLVHFTISNQNKLLKINLISIENSGKLFSGFVKVELLSIEREETFEFKPFRSRILKNSKNPTFNERFYFQLTKNIPCYKILFTLYKTNSLMHNKFMGKYLHEFEVQHDPSIEISCIRKFEKFKYLRTHDIAKHPYIELSLSYNNDVRALLVDIKKLVNLPYILNNRLPNSFFHIKFYCNCKQIENTRSQIYQQTCNPLINEKFIFKIPLFINNLYDSNNLLKQLELHIEIWHCDQDDVYQIGTLILADNETSSNEARLKWICAFNKPNEIFDVLFNLKF